MGSNGTQNDKPANLAQLASFSAFQGISEGKTYKSSLQKIIGLISSLPFYEVLKSTNGKKSGIITHRTNINVIPYDIRLRINFNEESHKNIDILLHELDGKDAIGLLNWMGARILSQKCSISEYMQQEKIFRYLFDIEVLLESTNAKSLPQQVFSQLDRFVGHEIDHACFASTKAKQQQLKYVVHHCGLTAEQESDIFILDSGSTITVCNRDVVMTNLDRSPSAQRKIRGLNSVATSTGVGLIGEVTSLYMPGAPINILSVSQLTGCGHEVLFKDKKAIVTNGQGKVIIVAHKKNGLWLCSLTKSSLSFTSTEKPENSFPAYGSSRLSNLAEHDHKAMGHAPSYLLRRAYKLGTLRGTKPPDGHYKHPRLAWCDTCSKGKIAKRRVPKVHLDPPTGPFECLAADICHITSSYDGNKYILVVIDEFTGYSWARKLPNLTKVATAMFNILRLISKGNTKRIRLLLPNDKEIVPQSDPESPVMRIRTDGGSEFTNQWLKATWANIGTAEIKSVPYESHCNGAAEKLIQDLSKIARCMVIQAELDLTYMADAYEYACFVRNRTPQQSRMFKTPYQRLSGRVPDISKIEIFGCPCIAHIDQKDKKHRPGLLEKAKPRGRPGIFLGIDSIAGYYKIKFTDKPSNTTFRRRSVYFNETKFGICDPVGKPWKTADPVWDYKHLADNFELSKDGTHLLPVNKNSDSKSASDSESDEAEEEKVTTAPEPVQKPKRKTSTKPTSKIEKLQHKLAKKLGCASCRWGLRGCQRCQTTIYRNNAYDRAKKALDALAHDIFLSQDAPEMGSDDSIFDNSSNDEQEPSAKFPKNSTTLKQLNANQIDLIKVWKQAQLAHKRDFHDMECKRADARVWPVYRCECANGFFDDIDQMKCFRETESTIAFAHISIPRRNLIEIKSPPFHPQPEDYEVALAVNRASYRQRRNRLLRKKGRRKRTIHHKDQRYIDFWSDIPEGDQDGLLHWLQLPPNGPNCSHHNPKKGDGENSNDDSGYDSLDYTPYDETPMSECESDIEYQPNQQAESPDTPDTHLQDVETGEVDQPTLIAGQTAQSGYVTKTIKHKTPKDPPESTRYLVGDPESEYLKFAPANSRTHEHSFFMQERKGQMLRDELTNFGNYQIASAYHAATRSNETPSGYKQAATQRVWKTSMQSEIRSLKQLGTFDLVPINEVDRKNGELLSAAWVYKIKEGDLHQLLKFKSRLVVRGDRQRPYFSFDPNNLYAPVASLDEIRPLLAWSASRHYFIHHLDVRSAYLHADLESDVWMHPPQGFYELVRDMKDSDGNPLFDIPHDGVKRVLKLKKSLYGLKQAAALWAAHLQDTLRQLGFKQSIRQSAIFYRDEGNHGGTKGEISIISTYVDDLILYVKTKSVLEDIKRRLKAAYLMTDMGSINWLLGVAVSYNRRAGSIKLNQTAFIENVGKRFGFEKPEVRKIDTPMQTGANGYDFFTSVELMKHDFETAEPVDATEYRSLIGSLLYICRGTRPDTATAVHIAATASQRPTTSHMRIARRILRYLLSTRHLPICYNKSADSICGMVDSDYGRREQDHRSRTGICLKFGHRLARNAVFTWRSKLQPLVSYSTTHAEFMAASSGGIEIYDLRLFLEEVGASYVNEAQGVICSDLYTDSNGAKTIAIDALQHHKKKMIASKYHQLRELVSGPYKVINLHWIQGTDNPADLFTKVLDKTLFCKYRDILMNLEYDIRTYSQTTFREDENEDEPNSY